MYVGTYSEVLGHVPFGKGRGIELFEYDTETGSLSPLAVQVIPLIFLLSFSFFSSIFFSSLSIYFSYYSHFSYIHPLTLLLGKWRIIHKCMEFHLGRHSPAQTYFVRCRGD